MNVRNDTNSNVNRDWNWKTNWIDW